VQLFIVVNLIFYFFVSYYHRSDYTPSAFDNQSSHISTRSYIQWAKPLDDDIRNSIDHLRDKKLEGYHADKIVGLSYKIYKKDILNDSTNFLSTQTEKTHVFLNSYDQKVSFFSKTLIFILIPVFALFFYLAFIKRLKYYGASLILATHFLTFNLLFYTLLLIVIYLPYQITGSLALYNLPYKGLGALLYSPSTKPFSNIVFGIYEGFEAMHVIAWTTWLFFCFKRLFKLHWVHNIIISYLLSRVFFLVVFSLYKKFLIAFTLWNM